MGSHIFDSSRELCEKIAENCEKMAESVKNVPGVPSPSAIFYFNQLKLSENIHAKKRL